jgi:hypothetical protein
MKSDVAGSFYYTQKLKNWYRISQGLLMRQNEFECVQVRRAGLGRCVFRADERASKRAFIKAVYSGLFFII